MKKGKFYYNTLKIVISAVTFVSVFSFTSCGKSEDKKSEKEENPEYVYESDFKELGNINMDYLSNSCFIDGKIYMTGTDMEYDKNYNIKSSKSYLLNCSSDGDKMDKTNISGLKDNEYASNLFLDNDNNMRMITSIQNYNKKTGSNDSKYYMMKIDETGKISERIEIKPDKKDSDNFYLSDNSILSDGKLLVYWDKKIYTFNEDGSAGQTIEADNYIDGMFTANNGKVYILSYIESQNDMGIEELDIKTGKFGEAIGLGNSSMYNVRHIKEASDGKIYLGNHDSLYEFDFKNKKAEILFNWINVDIDGSNVSDFTPLEDGSFFCLNTLIDYTNAGDGDISSDIELAKISKKKYSDTKKQKRLTLASNYIDLFVKREILKFNKTNDKYRIEVADYSSYDDPSEQLNLDIASGKIPDIIDVGYMPKNLYIKKGFFTDLYPFIDKDNEINKEDFIDNVRNTIEHDGKLYYIPTSFMINALAGPKKIFGDIEGWSYEDMEKIYNEMPEGSSFMHNMTSDWFVENMLSTQMDNFINYDTGEVNLDSEEFINMIEFSKNFKDNDEDTQEGLYMSSSDDGPDGGMMISSNDESYELVRKGKVLLKSMDMYDFSDIQINEKLFKSQGGYNIVSYPSSDKNNKLAISSASNCFAISDKCDDKEGAWSFLRRLYTYEYQKDVMKTNFGGFSIRKDVIDKQMEYAMATKEYTDDDGTKVKPVSNNSYNYGGFKITLKPYTKEQMDIFRSMLDRIGMEMDFGASYDEIPKIIKEETKAFYSGDKTAKEVAEVIQSRVSIYVNENK